MIRGFAIIAGFLILNHEQNKKTTIRGYAGRRKHCNLSSKLVAFYADSDCKEGAVSFPVLIPIILLSVQICVEPARAPARTGHSRTRSSRQTNNGKWISTNAQPFTETLSLARARFYLLLIYVVQ